MEFLTQTSYVRPHRDVARVAESVRRSAATPGDAVVELTRRLRDRVGYVPGVTQVHTLAGEVWKIPDVCPEDHDDDDDDD